MIALQGNPTTGYQWDASYDQRLVQLGDRQFAPSGPGVGAGGVELLRFKCLAVGNGKIVLNYRRPWETAVPPDEVVTFEVNVHQ